MTLWQFVIGYLITFTTYGTWLHGDDRGSHDRKTGKPLAPDKRLNRLRRDQLKYAPLTLDPKMRRIVRLAIEGCCEHKGWTLRKLNVRTNHVHCVILTREDSGRVLNAIKARATRMLREAKLVHASRPVWTAGGSRSALRTTEAVEGSVDYVANGQGPDLPEA